MLFMGLLWIDVIRVLIIDFNTSKLWRFLGLVVFFVNLVFTKKLNYYEMYMDIFVYGCFDLKLL